MISRNSLGKFSLLGSLYISQSLPFWFLYQALPVLLRQQGTSLEVIGLLNLVMAPMILKFLWSPLIDHYSFTKWGHYRFWIIFFQLWVVSITVICSVLNLESQLPLFVFLLVLLATGCASQDIATDALALHLLEPQERGMGNAVQGIGVSLGKMMGGGGMLILLNVWGWIPSLLLLATVMIVALLPVLAYREAPRKSSFSVSTINIKNPQEYLSIFLQFCQRPGIALWLIILGLYGAANRLSATMFQLLLIDTGFSVSDIGILFGIFGQSMMMLGTLIAGWLIPRWGRQRSLLIASSCSLVCLLSYFFLTFGKASPLMLYGIVGLAFFSTGMMVTASFTIMMDKSRLETAGTDYTIQASLIGLGGILSAALSGFLAEIVGYRGVFATSILLLLIYLALVTKRLKLAQT